jgi:hypothetical protein
MITRVNVCDREKNIYDLMLKSCLLPLKACVTASRRLIKAIRGFQFCYIFSIIFKQEQTKKLGYEISEHANFDSKLASIKRKGKYD